MMLLYRTDLVGGEVEDAIGSFESEHGFAMPEYAATLVRGVVEYADAVDDRIRDHLVDWTIERLGAVERSVLRIATWELCWGEVPGPVAIDEAVELSKRYATPEAAKLVNGVLAAIYRTLDTAVETATDTGDDT
jgi:N utilization substance protein B